MLSKHSARELPPVKGHILWASPCAFDSLEGPENILRENSKSMLNMENQF